MSVDLGTAMFGGVVALASGMVLAVINFALGRVGRSTDSSLSQAEFKGVMSEFREAARGEFRAIRDTIKGLPCNRAGGPCRYSSARGAPENFSPTDEAM